MMSIRPKVLLYGILNWVILPLEDKETALLHDRIREYADFQCPTILLERVRDRPAGFLNASQDHQTTGCMELINSLTPTVAMPDMTSAMA